MKLQPFELERYFAPYEQTVRHLLCCSDSESWSLEEILKMDPKAKAEFSSVRLGYPDTLGSHGLRSEIAKIYSGITLDDILVYSGAQEAIFLLFNALLDAGDEVIVHTPCYQSHTEIPRAAGCKVIRWEANGEDNWKLDFEKLESLITNKTKLIVVNFPHNPSGYVPTKDEFEHLGKIADKHGIYFFSDEVYRESEHTGTSTLPAACDISEMGISLGVMSKTYGLAGLRIGWLATKNRKALDLVLGYKDYTSICNSTLSEYVAEVALKNRAYLVNRNLEIIENNLKLLNQFFNRHEEKFEWTPPTAGPIAFPKLKLEESVDSFCLKLVTIAGILLLPGSVYGEQYNSHFRIGFGRKNMPEALAEFEKHIE